MIVVFIEVLFVRVVVSISVPAVCALDDSRDIGPAEAHIPEFPITEGIQYLGFPGPLAAQRPQGGHAIESCLESGKKSAGWMNGLFLTGRNQPGVFG
jgi:hypothetical protein